MTYIVRRTLYAVHCTSYIVWRTLYDVHCTTYIVRRTMYGEHYTCDKWFATIIYSHIYVCIGESHICTVYNVRHTLYVQCTTYILRPSGVARIYMIWNNYILTYTYVEHLVAVSYDCLHCTTYGRFAFSNTRLHGESGPCS